MDSDSSAKFSFAFLLAILFHLLLIFLLILGLSFPAQGDKKKTLQAMQAWILEMPPAAENIPEPIKKLSRADKKRLAHSKHQAWRLAQTEKKKLLAATAQQLVIETLQAQKQSQELVKIELKIKSLWSRPADIKGMSCVIQVSLFDTGQIKKIEVTKSSGNKMFDEAAKNAVYKAVPFQISDDEVVRQKMLTSIFVHFGDE